MKSKLHAYLHHLLSGVFLLTMGIVANAQVGQNNFKYQNPKPLGATFNDVSFFGNNNGVAVGLSSSIARTADGGATWTYGVVLFNAASGLKERPTLNDAHFTTANTVYAVGDAGMMIKSTDGGVNWIQINNPLYASARNIKAVCFINKDTGYIGGQAQDIAATTATELAPNTSPKLYFTKNGGNTWDSINAPIGAPTMLGFIASPTNQPLKKPIASTAKEINRIVFNNDSVGYIVGSAGALSGSGYSVSYPGGSSTVTTWHTSLVWKFKKGVLTDYSVTKEKFGVTGINASTGNAPTATTLYGTVLPFTSTNLWTAVPINDSVVLVAGSNGYIFKIRAGVNDSTALAFNPAYTPNLQGVFAKGKYEFSNFSGNNGYPVQTVPPLPPQPSRLLFSTMNNMKKAPDGKIYTNHGVNTPLTTIASSNDDGVTWSLLNGAPGYTVSAATVATPAMDVTPNGTIHFMGVNGFSTKSTNGTVWMPNYSTVTFNAGLNKMEFADCNNGIIMGNAGLLLSTNDGGKTWVDKTIGSFGPTVSTLGISYPDVNRFYFTATNGNIYFSSNQGTSNNLLFVPGRPSTNYGLATWGTGNTTKIFVTSYRSTAALNERVVVYRSLNNGATWDTVKAFAAMTPATNNINIPQVVKFVDANTAYLAAGKNFLFKTTDGGTTWTNISPDATLNSSTAFGGQHAIGISPSGNTLMYWCLVSTTRYMYKSTNAGATWTSNIMPITVGNEPVFNFTDFLMHDDNNFIGLTGANRIMITNDGANTWRFDHAPSGALFNAAAFLPKTVPTGTPMANRKTVMIGNQIFEYGASSTNVSSAENITTSCVTASNGAITITAAGGVAPYTYSINGGAFQSSNTFNNLAVGTYIIAIKDQGCGPDYTKTVSVGVRPSPSIFAGNDRTIVDGDEIVLDGTGTTTSTSIVWSPNTTIVNGANTYTPTVKPRSTTNYLLTVTDANACVSTDNVTITVIPYCLKVQNAFSPNADGINDRWQVTNGAPCFNKIMAAVYNRYGNLVYKNDNYQNNWDGTYEGKPLPDGTYYYVVTYNLINGKGQVLKGDVTILR